jgi:hypothetical protein
MTFKAATIIMAPDGDPQKHRSSLKTDKLEVTTVIVHLWNFDQAASLARDLVQKEGVQSIMLCPGFTASSVAKASEAVGEGAPINVSRGDSPKRDGDGRDTVERGLVPRRPLGDGKHGGMGDSFLDTCRSLAIQ